MERDFDYFWWTGTEWERRDALPGALPNPRSGPARFPDDIHELLAAQPLRLPPPPLASTSHLPPPPQPSPSTAHLPPPPPPNSGSQNLQQVAHQSANIASSSSTAVSDSSQNSNGESACSSCGTLARNSASFCGNCGSKLSTPS